MLIHSLNVTVSQSQNQEAEPASQLIKPAASHPQDWWHDGNIRGTRKKLSKAFLSVTANIVIDVRHFTQISRAAEGVKSTGRLNELTDSYLVKITREPETTFPIQFSFSKQDHKTACFLFKREIQHQNLITAYLWDFLLTALCPSVFVLVWHQMELQEDASDASQWSFVHKPVQEWISTYSVWNRKRTLQQGGEEALWDGASGLLVQKIGSP